MHTWSVWKIDHIHDRRVEQNNLEYFLDLRDLVNEHFNASVAP